MTPEQELENVLGHLRQEAKRLTPNQGRIARRNARRAVLGALRQVRNVLNEHYPRLERTDLGEERWVIEVFEKAHREGAGRKSRYLNPRWIVVREHFITAGPLPARLFDKKGVNRPLPFKTTAKYAKRIAAKMPASTFRIRQAGADHVLMADIL